MTGRQEELRVTHVLGLDPARRWVDCEALERCAVLEAVAREATWLFVPGVRELLANAWLHGRPDRSDGELAIDGFAAMATLRLPGVEFDSVLAATRARNRWLHRYGRMLAAERVRWAWRRVGALNVIEFTFEWTRVEGGSS